MTLTSVVTRVDLGDWPNALARPGWLGRHQKTVSDARNIVSADRNTVLNVRKAVSGVRKTSI